MEGPRSEALPKTRRLAKRREFVSVYEKGRKYFSRSLVVFVAPNDLPHSRIGITATRKLGKANIRNRFKRWTREVYRKRRVDLGLDARSVDVVVNVKPSAAEVSFADYRREFETLLQRISRDAPTHPQ